MKKLILIVWCLFGFIIYFSPAHPELGQSKSFGNTWVYQISPNNEWIAVFKAPQTEGEKVKPVFLFNKEKVLGIYNDLSK